MERLTRPDIDADQTAVRFMETEVKIQDIGELLGLILNGPTINSIRKDTLRHLVRQLYTELKRYEDTGLTPEEVKEMCENVDTRMLQWFEHKYGICAGQMMGLSEADQEGRLWVAPCKMGTTLYMVVTKRPKLNWPEFSFIKTTSLTEHNFFRVIRDLGKTVFLTREEAEDALARKKAV